MRPSFHRDLRWLLLAASLSFAAACGDSGDTTGSSTTTGSGGAGGQATTGGAAQGGGGGAAIFVPTPADVDFEAVAPLPAGEQIVFNDWDASPNELLSMQPDGTGVTTVFRSYRIWSFGVSRGADQIAFAAGDPDQEKHYGPLFGDSIQPTFLYSVATETAENLSAGNLNDECHHFGPGDAFLYLCRRYDFDVDGMFKGYRIGRIDLATRSFSFLSDENPEAFTLNAQPTPDESEIVFERVPIPGTRTIVRRPTAGGTETSLKQNAGSPVLSPDGGTLLFSDYTQMGSLVAQVGAVETVVAQGPGISNAKLSPDGTKVVYLRDDGAVPCSHVEIAALDGSQVASPTRIYDCVTSGRFISDIAWITN